jgi:hypothetical protein
LLVEEMVVHSAEMLEHSWAVSKVALMVDTMVDTMAVAMVGSKVGWTVD